MKLWAGNVFNRVCQSVFSGTGLHMTSQEPDLSLLEDQPQPCPSRPVSTCLLKNPFPSGPVQTCSLSSPFMHLQVGGRYSAERPPCSLDGIAFVFNNHV